MPTRDDTDGAEQEAPAPLHLARRLAALPDPRMRAAVLRETVLTLAPEAAAWLLDNFATAGRAGGPPFDLALLAAVDLVSEEMLGYDAQRRVFEAARRLGLASAADLLLSPGSVAGDGGAAAPRALVPGTRPLTLGERKSLARSWRQDVLERLVTDPHEDVVTLLLANPHLTEASVLRIATARRSSPAVLELLLRHRRWSCRPAVRRALIRNPRLPLATALRLVGLLNRTELRELARDPHLPPRLADAVTRRLSTPS